MPAVVGMQLPCRVDLIPFCTASASDRPTTELRSGGRTPAVEALLSSRSRTRPCSMRRLVELVVDDRRFFEIQPDLGRCVTTSLSRLARLVVAAVVDVGLDRRVEHAGQVECHGRQP